MRDERTFTAFIGDSRISTGNLATVLTQVKGHSGERGDGQLLIFDDTTGRQVDFDLRGTTDEVLAREVGTPAKPGPGRPRLGVVSREVSLLPRHWDWLSEQPSGASAALRRLVDEARRNESREQLAKHAAATAGRAMTVLAGDRTNFEEAYRALDKGDRERFEGLIAEWPEDVRNYLTRLVKDAFLN